MMRPSRSRLRNASRIRQMETIALASQQTPIARPSRVARASAPHFIWADKVGILTSAGGFAILAYLWGLAAIAAGVHGANHLMQHEIGLGLRMRFRRRSECLALSSHDRSSDPRPGAAGEAEICAAIARAAYRNRLRCFSRSRFQPVNAEEAVAVAPDGAGRKPASAASARKPSIVYL